MKKLISPILCLAVAMALCSGTSFAQDKKDEKKDEKGKPAEKKKSDTLPFNGKVTARDATAMTITLSGKTARVVSITSETRITKDGKPATFDDAKVGEDVRGALKEVAGKLQAVSLSIGAPPPAKKKDGEKKGEEKKKEEKK